MGELKELPKSEIQKAEDRMASVEEQLRRKLKPGEKRVIRCPYCNSFNFPHREFCCELLRSAILAVLIGDRMLETAEAGERMMQN